MNLSIKAALGFGQGISPDRQTGRCINMAAWAVLVSVAGLLLALFTGRARRVIAFGTLAAAYLVFGLVDTTTWLQQYTNPALATLLLLLLVSLAFERSPLLDWLSYASILGGMTTLVGTSTNLVVNALTLRSGGFERGMFTFALVGVPVALLTLGVVLWRAASLPDHRQRAGHRTRHIERGLAVSRSAAVAWRDAGWPSSDHRRATAAVSIHALGRDRLDRRPAVDAAGIPVSLSM